MVGPKAAANVRGLVSGIISCIIIKAHQVCTPFYFSYPMFTYLFKYCIAELKGCKLDYTVIHLYIV